ncbi:hypothetical protein AWH69_14300 [Janibacter melonis]|uniref:Heavy metal transporter n=1 Tax=Janibacter melonis TaxID=262209 RepID=A0A176Q9V1_9MICO|nr:hypothetical protein [Janibacter melonis]OAB86497.1 hypothetical protein AWH69_14300 [Janibacter melonis]
MPPRRPAADRPPLAEERAVSRARVRRNRALVASVAVLGLLGGGAWWVRDKVITPWSESCEATALEQDVSFTPEQMHNAATIVQVAERRGLPARAGSIGVATAIQESKLRNITYGDRDSVGLFQQRPSQGWGTVEQILDPRYSTNAFYDALVKVDGWQDMRITEIAQEVQRSAYPEAYADHEHEGRTIASAISGHSPEGLVCRLDPPTGAGDRERLVESLRTETGYRADTGDGGVVVRASQERRAWGVGAWAVATAKGHGVTSVQVGDRVWTREDGSSWSTAPDPVDASTVRITLADG